MNEYQVIKAMSRREKDAYFCSLRGSGCGRLLTVYVSPALFEEIDCRKIKSRAAIIRRLLYMGIAEQKRLELLHIRRGSKAERERQADLDHDAEFLAGLSKDTLPIQYCAIIGPANPNK